MLTALIPTVFTADLEVGLDLFVDGIGMRVLHRDDELVVLARDRAKVFPAPGADAAATDRPELSVETDDIDALHREISARRPDLLHPGLPEVTERPWGAREFAVLDATTVCVVFRQWSAEQP